MRISSSVLLLLLLACEDPALFSNAAQQFPEPSSQGPVGRQGSSSTAETRCFWGETSQGTIPLTKVIYELVSTDRGAQVDTRIVFNREFVDLSYGANSIGWDHRKDGHKFKELVGSDHTELVLLDGAGQTAFQAKLDLITDNKDGSYESQGPFGGDGKIIVGEEAHVLAFGSSLDDNFNQYGYVLTQDSPETDASYAINSSYENWNFFVEYRVSVDAEAFGDDGFGDVLMEMVHASPSKFDTNTVTVEEGDCPPPGDEDPFCPPGECTDSPSGPESDCPPGECTDSPSEGGSEPPPSNDIPNL